MSIAVEHTAIKAPSTYQDWLVCFDMMKNGSGADTEVFDAACMGSFVGSDLTKNALQKQIVETVNAFLDKSVELLFKRLKKDVAKSLFFTKLSFLPKDFRSDLENSVKEQMSGFWEDTIKFLYEQSLEFSNSELEDVLFLVKRIRLF